VRWRPVFVPSIVPNETARSTSSVRSRVRPRKRQRLAWPQPRVGEHGDERRVAHQPLTEQRVADRLDGLGRERNHRSRSTHRGLAHRRDRVRRDPAPFARPLEHALEQREALANRRRPDTVRLELQAEAVHHVRRQLAQRDRAEPRQDVCVPLHGVDLERRLREVRLGVQPPPLLAEVREQLLAGVELRQLAGALLADELGVEGLRVALATEHLRAVAAALAPSHAPHDGAVLALDSLDAHDAALRSSATSSRRKLPRAGGTSRVRTTGGGGSTRTALRATQSSKSSRAIRNREHSRDARRSPRSIAR
jgi:hypothetical protein